MQKLPGRKRLSTVLFLSILGFIISLYLTFQHYSLVRSVCDISATISCTAANSSIYAVFLNVPVALFGMLWCGVTFFMVQRSMHHEETRPLLFIWSALGLIAMGYFIWAEIMLGTLCIFCTVVHAILLWCFFLTVQLTKIPLQKKELRRWWMVAVLFILPIILFTLFAEKETNYERLANCLRRENTVLYGTTICSSCDKIEALFGPAFETILSVDCSQQTTLCTKKSITQFPTWIREKNGVETQRKTGFLNVVELKQFSGC